MTTKHQVFAIPIPDDYSDMSDIEKELLGEVYLDYILKRTEDGMGKGRKDFPAYSKEYIESINFKIAGKSKSDVNLTLSGDMLGALQVLEIQENQILVGFEDGSAENAIADGNIRGTYGKDSPNRRKARDFLNATKDELAEYVFSKIKDEEKRKQDAEALALAKLAQEAGGPFPTPDDFTEPESDGE